ncbi:MAG: SDR family NAD(P)-dependent oxidoreductase [Alphaproteobacteria bacterium]|nr:SDR family NAD(P)-dependent oxidoreductase [Alphaproteobacteria bacterium]
MTSPLPFDGRLALVTGATRGIGRAVALLLAQGGAHVIATGRTAGALEELDDAIQKSGRGPATLVPMDLRQHEAIDRLGGTIFERWQRLDILIGNAGVLGPLTPVAQIEPKAFAELLDVNLTANYRLIRSMDPLLRLSRDGRALFLTSGAAGRHRPYWGGYAMTKAALEDLVLTYAAEAASSGVKVNLYNPGATRTAMRAKAMPGEDPASLPTAETVAAHLVGVLTRDDARSGEIIAFRGT